MRMGLFGYSSKSYGFPLYGGSGSVTPFSPQLADSTIEIEKKLHYQNIVMMPEYMDTSEDELRYADYLLNRKGLTRKINEPIVSRLKRFMEPTAKQRKAESPILSTTEASDSDSEEPSNKKCKLELLFSKSAGCRGVLSKDATENIL